MRCAANNVSTANLQTLTNEQELKHLLWLAWIELDALEQQASKDPALRTKIRRAFQRREVIAKIDAVLAPPAATK
jgi:hypothetical protein